jgi:hypothetical protein
LGFATAQIARGEGASESTFGCVMHLNAKQSCVPKYFRTHDCSFFGKKDYLFAANPEIACNNALPTT